jgi:histidine decarboxylase
MSSSAKGASEHEDIAKELDALRDRLEAAAATNIGFPATADFDYSALAPFFARYMLNNLGDPYSDGAYPMHTKPMEREVVDTVADLFGAPVGDRWGYVAAGATEGTEYALHLASTLHADAVVYHSTAAHHAITNVIQRLGLTSIPVRADALGEIDYDDLADQVNLRRHSSAIVVANIGTAVTEAVDDVSRIAQVLDRCAVRRRWIHGDAALSGIPLALLDPDERPSIDFPAGIDSVVTSGHKFLGSPVPSAVVVVRNSHRLAHARAITYTGSPDTTVGNSRSGLAAMVLWYAIRTHGIDGLRARAEQSRQLAAAAHDALREIGWPAHRHKHAMSVSFPTPPASVTAKWVLATHGATSLIVCMPGVTAEQIDAFVADLRAAITPATVTAAAAEMPAAPVVSATVVPAQAGPGRTAATTAAAGPSAPKAASGKAAGSTAAPTIRQSRPPVSRANGGPAAGNGAAPDAVPSDVVPSDAVALPAGSATTPSSGSSAAGSPPIGTLWADDVVEETLAPMPSLAPLPMSRVSPAPVPSPAATALIARTPSSSELDTEAAGVDDLPRAAESEMDRLETAFASPAAPPVPVAMSAPAAAGGPSAAVGAVDVEVEGRHAEVIELHADADVIELRPDPAAPAPDTPPAPMGPLLPTPPQSLQRQKMLRRAGMPIRL